MPGTRRQVCLRSLVFDKTKAAESLGDAAGARARLPDQWASLRQRRPEEMPRPATKVSYSSGDDKARATNAFKSRAARARIDRIRARRDPRADASLTRAHRRPSPSRPPPASASPRSSGGRASRRRTASSTTRPTRRRRRARRKRRRTRRPARQSRPNSTVASKRPSSCSRRVRRGMRRPPSGSRRPLI